MKKKPVDTKQHHAKALQELNTTKRKAIQESINLKKKSLAVAPAVDHKSQQYLVEVDFFDMKNHVKGIGEVCYNNRVARVIVSDDKMVPFALREAGFNPEKIIKTRVVREAGKVTDEDRTKIAEHAKVKQAEKRKSPGAGGNRGGFKASTARYMFTSAGVKQLKPHEMSGQPKIVAQAIMAAAVPVSIDDVVKAVGNKIQTKSSPRAIVSFYFSRWRKSGHLAEKSASEVKSS